MAGLRAVAMMQTSGFALIANALSLLVVPLSDSGGARFSRLTLR
jgi:hypothetical protein